MTLDIWTKIFYGYQDNDNKIVSGLYDIAVERYEKMTCHKIDIDHDYYFIRLHCEVLIDAARDRDYGFFDSHLFKLRCQYLHLDYLTVKSLVGRGWKASGKLKVERSVSTQGVSKGSGLNH